jgi:hypothetical protein
MAKRPTPGPGFLAHVDALTDEELEQFADGGENVVLGMRFWTDELARRRSAKLYESIATTSKATADQLDRLAELTADQAAGADRMVRLTVAIAWLTLANVAVAAVTLAATVLGR